MKEKPFCHDLFSKDRELNVSLLIFINENIRLGKEKPDAK